MLNEFQYPRVDRLVSAGYAAVFDQLSNDLFQYPRVDRLVSAGQKQQSARLQRIEVSVSSGGSIGVCWTFQTPPCADGWWFQYPRVDRLVSAGSPNRRAAPPPIGCFSILGWIDWCLLAIGCDGDVEQVSGFQYPRVDRLVSAGCRVGIRYSRATCFSILGWIDWCLLVTVSVATIPDRDCFSILGWIDWCLLAGRRTIPGIGSRSFSILGWIDWCLLAW